MDIIPELKVHVLLTRHPIVALSTHGVCMVLMQLHIISQLKSTEVCGKPQFLLSKWFSLLAQAIILFNNETRRREYYLSKWILLFKLLIFSWFSQGPWNIIFFTRWKHNWEWFSKKSNLQRIACLLNFKRFQIYEIIVWGNYKLGCS